MTYQDALAELTAAHRDQIEADLETARGQYEDATAHLVATQRRLHMLEGLLTTGGKADVRGHEKVPIGGQVAVPAGGQ